MQARDHDSIRSLLHLLSPREHEVVMRGLRGEHNKLIAHEMGLAHSTVRVLFWRAATKLGVGSRSELLAMLRRSAASTFH
jgi:DNA-binding CsgD family transcriptional regulator